MKKYLIIGGSKGISKEIVKMLSEKGHYCYLISRTAPDFEYNGTHFLLNVLTDELPKIETLHGIVYGVGTINLKPFNRLSTEDFQNDWQINVMGAVKVIQIYLPSLRHAEQASVVNAIAPSIVDTPLAAGILRSDSIKENMIVKHPLKRILLPQDVAKTAVFLLGEDSNGITGQIFIQDNGLISISN